MSLEDEMYARILVAEIERDAAIFQLREREDRVLFLEKRIEAMRKSLAWECDDE